MVKGIGHNALKVSDMEKAVAFYTQICGLTKAFEINDEAGNPWIVYMRVSPGTFVELFYGGEKQEGKQYAGEWIGYHHFCFETDDIEPLTQLFYEKGLIQKPEYTKGEDGNYSLWIHDPDGNAVEFVQYMPGSIHLAPSK